MFERLMKRFFISRQEDKTDSDAKIAALEKEVAELKALVEKQARRAGEEKNQRTATGQTNTSSKQVPSHPNEKASYFDMEEYFCNGHDDTAVDVIQYDGNGNVISRETFRWNSGCDEVTSEGIWGKANTYARSLIQGGIPCRKKSPISTATGSDVLSPVLKSDNGNNAASARAAYFDWEDTSWENSKSGTYKIAVTITQYDQDGNVVAREIFSEDRVDKETQKDLLKDAWESVWKKADEYAETLKKSGILIRNEIRNGIKRRYSIAKEQYPDVPEKDMKDYRVVCEQPLGPFFPKGGAVLVDSLGNWEKDVEEAQRRMDLFFSTAEAFKFARQRDAAAECRGAFRTKRNYSYTFWSREYFHSHDGWDTEGESATIIRISPEEFYHPSDPNHAKERVLAMYGEQNTQVRLNGWGNTSFEQLWNVPEVLGKQEQERYYLDYNKFRAKNFLGMVGYFEICSF